MISRKTESIAHTYRGDVGSLASVVVDLMTLTAFIAYTYGNESQWEIILYHMGNGATDEWKRKALPIKEW